MRRSNIDLSYKQRSREIIERYYKPWQLPYQTPLDPIHRIANTMVSVSQEFKSELDYIESMFFPDRFDFNEEWIVYHTPDVVDLETLYITDHPVYSGDVPLLSGQIREAISIDDFIAGQYDYYYSYNSTEINESIIDIETDENNICILSNNSIHYYDINNLDYINSETIYQIPVSILNAYIDKDHLIYPITIPSYKEGIQVTDSYGNRIKVKYLNIKDQKLSYRNDFDRDGDGVIGDHEISFVSSLIGMGQSDFTPEEWENIKWADVNKDGYIDQTDYKYISQYKYVMREDYDAILIFPKTSKGKYKVEIIHAVDPVIGLLNNDGIYRLKESGDLAGYSKVAIDSISNIGYGISGNQLWALKLTKDSSSVVNRTNLHIVSNNEKIQLIDVAVYNGYVYLLARTDNSQIRLYNGDIRKEYIEIIDYYGIIDIDIIPDGISVSPTGQFILWGEGSIYRLKAGRDKYIIIDDILFMNRKYSINSNEISIPLLPRYLFNSFDAFAYSFGMTRPPGSDNYTMYKMIYDFYKHPHDNSTVGINYGLKRELGFDNIDLSLNDYRYKIPAPINTDEPLFINDSSIILSETDDGFTFSGDVGSGYIIDNNILIPGIDIHLQNRELILSGTFIDGDGYDVNLKYEIKLKAPYYYPDINIHSLQDQKYQEVEYFPYTPDEFKSYVEQLEKEDPSLYRNAILDTMPVSSSRLSPKPVIPLTYGPEIIISGETTITL